MHKDKYVFAQLATFLDRSKFNRIVAKYDGDKHVKSYTCWNQLLTMMFGQLSGRESLRDLVVAMEAHSRKLYHRGMGRSVTRSNLAKANENRDYRIFEELASPSSFAPRPIRTSSMALGLASVRRLHDRAGSKKMQDRYFQARRLGLRLLLHDHRPVSVSVPVGEVPQRQRRDQDAHALRCQNANTCFCACYTRFDTRYKGMPEIPYERGAYYIFDRGYNDFGNLYRIHLLDAHFVLRAKRNLNVRLVSWKRRLPTGVKSDAVVEFVIYKSSKGYPKRLRRVVYVDAETKTEYLFLTNDQNSPALTIAAIYRNRWSVELFFKWIKQHLKINRFWGTTENAVRIQIYCAIITYCLVAIVQHDLLLERSVYEVLQILGISLTDKTPIRDLFDKSNLNIFKEPDDSCEPNLFNF